MTHMTKPLHANAVFLTTRAALRRVLARFASALMVVALLLPCAVSASETGATQPDSPSPVAAAPAALGVHILVDDLSISRVVELTARITFENADTLPAPVQVVSVLFDHAGVELFRSVDDLIIERERIFVKHFFDAPELVEGQYALHLRVLHSADREERFTAAFTVVRDDSDREWVWWFLGTLAVLLCVLCGMWRIERRRMHMDGRPSTGGQLLRTTTLSPIELALIFVLVTLGVSAYVMLWAYGINGSWTEVDFVTDVPYGGALLMSVYLTVISYLLFRRYRGGITLTLGFVGVVLTMAVVVPQEKLVFLYPEMRILLVLSAFYPTTFGIGVALVAQGFTTLMSHTDAS